MKYLARLLGKKVDGVDIVGRKCMVATGYLWRGKFYFWKFKGYQRRYGKDI